jgi:GH35 family endo-1,4-beta-xylanase
VAENWMTENEIYQAAIVKWGADHQIDKAIEECSELIAALIQHRDGRVPKFDVANEVADVEIMCGQMRVLFGNDQVNNCKQHKLNRLQKLISEE